jgi:hypothetical protein
MMSCVWHSGWRYRANALDGGRCFLRNVGVYRDIYRIRTDLYSSFLAV